MAVQPAFNVVEGLITVVAVTWLATRLMDVVRDMARLAVIARGQMATLPVIDSPSAWPSWWSWSWVS